MERRAVAAQRSRICVARDQAVGGLYPASAVLAAFMIWPWRRHRTAR